MRTFKEFTNICDGYVPLRTSDQPYEDGFPTRTLNWSKKYTKALLDVGKQKFRSGMNIGDPINNLVRGVSAAARLDAIKKVDAEPESVRAKRSQARSEANKQLGANRRKLQTSMDRQHLIKSLRGSGSLEGTGGSIGHQPGDRYGISGMGLAD